MADKKDQSAAVSDDKAKSDTSATGASVPTSENLVKMFKDGQTIEVHPTAVEGHRQVGWKSIG